MHAFIHSFTHSFLCSPVHSHDLHVVGRQIFSKRDDPFLPTPIFPSDDEIHNLGSLGGAWGHRFQGGAREGPGVIGEGDQNFQLAVGVRGVEFRAIFQHLNLSLNQQPQAL